MEMEMKMKGNLLPSKRSGPILDYANGTESEPVGTGSGSHFQEPIATSSGSGSHFQEPVATEVVRLVKELPPAHCILKVDSFSLLQQEDHFESTEFSVGSYTWMLSVYPNGNKEENGGGHLSLYVTMIDKLCFGTSVNAVLRFFIYDQIRDNYLTVLDLTEKRFHTMKRQWGISKLLPVGLFTDVANGFLVKDCCVFGAEILIINGENKASMISVAKTSVEKTDRRYKWKIEKYSKLKTDSVLHSPVFTFEGWSWKLCLYPRGAFVGKGNSVSLYLHLQNYCDFNNGSKLYAKYTLCLKNQLNGSDHTNNIMYWFIRSEGGYGTHTSFPLSDLNDPLKGFLVDDAIIIEVSVETMLLLTDN